MALGSDVRKQFKPEELEELLIGLERLLDRTKVLYEQYFMGIQKLAPLQLHRDVERRVRELMQQQIRNTTMRFRFTTLCQKYGSYSTYWKRTLREIEQGKYVRELTRFKRKADQMGEELPEELLLKLPKLIQDRIRRDRVHMAERAVRDAERAISAQASSVGDSGGDESLALHEISEAEAQTLFNEGDLDLDNLFQALTEAPVPEGTPAGATLARPAADSAEVSVGAPASAREPDTAAAPPESGDAEGAPDMDSPADGPVLEESPGTEPAEPRAQAAGKGRARAKARTVTSPMGKAIAAQRPVLRAGTGPPAEEGASVFRVPLPPGASPRAITTPPESPDAALPLPPVLPRTATGPQTPPVPRTMTGQQTPPDPAPAPPPVPPRTVTGQQQTPPPRVATGPPPLPRAATAQPAPRTMTGQQTPPPRASTPPPTPRAATARGAEPPPSGHRAPALPPGMDDRECRDLYARYLKARQLVGESNDDVTYERLVTSLSKQANAIMNQHSARGVQFHVVVRGDKVVLKAKPLKPGKDE